MAKGFSKLTSLWNRKQLDDQNRMLEELYDGEGKIKNDSVTNNKLANNSVTQKKITDNQVTMNKLDFLPVIGKKEANLFNRYSTTKNTYIDPTDGKEKPSSVFESSEFIELEEGKTYNKNTNNGGAWYNFEKNYIAGVSNGVNTLTPQAGQKYFRYSINKISLETAMFVKDKLPQSYIEPISLSATMIGSDIIDKVESQLVELLNWKLVVFENNTLNFGKRFTVSNSKNGYYCLVLEKFDLTFKLEDGDSLILKWDGKKSVTETSNVFITRRLSAGLNIDEQLLATRIADRVISPIPSIQSVIDMSQVKIPKIEENIIPFSVTEKLSELSPNFFKNHRKKERDLTVVMVGDSISTNNYYTTQRIDAKNRPPLMTEKSYISYIEEQLRWDGQKYFRYDTGIFTETSDEKKTLEYDTANWDWETLPNNRPAFTRVLSGNNCSVSYTIPSDVWRCDFIFRTDKLNADNTKIIIEKGNNILEIFDDATSSWVEANSFTYSAKETLEKDTVWGRLRKSVYQKRLKMRFKTTIQNGTKVTIQNTGNGRLTYWGIQTGIRKVMLDFISVARGGHSIQKIENFEEWDIDYFNPSLILWQLPVLNHNMDVATSSFIPKNMGASNAAVFSNKFLVKRIQLDRKVYKPEVISYILWFGSGNNAINNNNDWVYGYCDDGSKVSVPSYIYSTISTFLDNNYQILDLFSLFMNYVTKSSLENNRPILLDTLQGSGVTGNTLTIDGGHFNNKGAILTQTILGNLFLS